MVAKIKQKSENNIVFPDFFHPKPIYCFGAISPAMISAIRWAPFSLGWMPSGRILSASLAKKVCRSMI